MIHPWTCGGSDWHGRFGMTALLILACGLVRAEAPTAEDSHIEYLPVQQIATLANVDLVESSGLAVSRRQPGLLWSHNDSGDAPRIFAFDEQGRDLGVCVIDGAQAIDWEDMASFEKDGVSWLLIADVGDNAKRREECQLYLVREPHPAQARATITSRIRFRYATGPRDCEAVAVDVHTNTVLLIDKALPDARVFALSLPELESEELLVAQLIATIAIPWATAMDISADGRRAIVATYGPAYEFHRGVDEDWSTAFRREPRRLEMPARRQGESICYGLDGESLYLTSEKLPTPLWKLTRRKATPAGNTTGFQFP